MKLHDVDLGPYDADLDQNINNYFISFGEYEEFVSKKKFIMIGVKGTGKSAVKKYLSGKKKKEGNYIIEIEKGYSIPSEKIKEKTEFEIRDSLASLIIKHIIQFFHENEYIDKEKKNKIKKLRDSIFDKLKQTVENTSIDFHFQFSLEKLFSQEQSDISKVINTKTINTLLEVINDKELWIFIDDIHEVFSINDPEASIRFVAGLIYLASDINIKYFEQKVNIVLFIRNEIYQKLLLSATELDKEIQYIWYVRWHHEELIKFLFERIKWCFKESSTKSWETWRKLFEGDTKEEIEEIQNYLIKRVINGPRDLLMLVNMARIKANNNRAERIEIKHIKESEYEYGEEKLYQINRNFSETYENIKYILEKYFINRNQILSKKELDNIIIQIIDNEQSIYWIRSKTKISFLHILYEIGFIGFFDNVHKRFIYSLEIPKIPNVSSQMNFKIHDAFIAYLELTMLSSPSGDTDV